MAICTNYRECPRGDYKHCTKDYYQDRCSILEQSRVKEQGERFEESRMRLNKEMKFKKGDRI